MLLKSRKFFLLDIVRCRTKCKLWNIHRREECAKNHRIYTKYGEERARTKSEVSIPWMWSVSVTVCFYKLRKYRYFQIFKEALIILILNVYFPAENIFHLFRLGASEKSPSCRFFFTVILEWQMLLVWFFWLCLKFTCSTFGKSPTPDLLKLGPVKIDYFSFVSIELRQVGKMIKEIMRFHFLKKLLGHL